MKFSLFSPILFQLTVPLSADELPDLPEDVGPLLVKNLKMVSRIEGIPSAVYFMVEFLLLFCGLFIDLPGFEISTGQHILSGQKMMSGQKKMSDQKKDVWSKKRCLVKKRCLFKKTMSGQKKKSLGDQTFCPITISSVL